MTDLGRWSPLEPPLPPRVVVAEDDVAHRLLGGLLTWSDEALLAIEGVASTAPHRRGRLIALRSARPLPWTDGVRYFGEAPQAPGLFIPTVHRPDGPLPLLARALRRRLGDDGPLVWLRDGRVIPLGAARPLARVTVQAWRAT